MYCPYCGAELPEGSVFCGNCSASLITQEDDGLEEDSDEGAG